MTKKRKEVTQEVCKDIATAMVARWTHNEKDYKKVISMVFKAEPKKAVENLSRELACNFTQSQLTNKYFKP